MEAGSLAVMSTPGVSAPLGDGIGPTFEAQTGLRPAMTFDPASVLLDAVAGRAGFAVQQMSGLAAVPGVELIGPFPAPCHAETVFTAAAFVQPGRQEQARAFIAHPVGPGPAAALNAAGLEAVGRGGAPSHG